MFERGVVVGRVRCGRNRGGIRSRDGGFHDGEECSTHFPPFAWPSFDAFYCTHQEQDSGGIFGLAGRSLDMEVDVHSCQREGRVFSCVRREKIFHCVNGMVFPCVSAAEKVVNKSMQANSQQHKSEEYAGLKRPEWQTKAKMRLITGSSLELWEEWTCGRLRGRGVWLLKRRRYAIRHPAEERERSPSTCTRDGVIPREGKSAGPPAFVQTYIGGKRRSYPSCKWQGPFLTHSAGVYASSIVLGTGVDRRLMRTRISPSHHV
eukprot:1140908-Pelagomonas_calceolata.AAC.5